MTYRAYNFILKNKNRFKQQLTPSKLKDAYKRGGKIRGNQMKIKMQENKRMTQKLINTGSFNKPNGKPNITAIAKELNLSRVTITKILKETLFSFIPLIFISYAYLNSYIEAMGVSTIM